MKPQISKQLQEMKRMIQKEEIDCLRISDFNTTGLLGVTGGDNTPWHYLVHGSGLSDKSETSGGSKGIGKFATFVTSNFNTVFYSTKTTDGETGYEGICKLCSARKDGTNQKTQGIGYFGSSDENEPVPGELRLDPNFMRIDDQYGSDIFVVGFKKPEGWKRDIISKTLDSFMAAVVYGALEVVVDDITINCENLSNIVFDDSLINKNVKKSVVSQYLLLTDKEHRFEDTITIDDYGTAKLFLLEFNGEMESYATNDCVMIRYPYMKIKDISKISSLPCSAMCIIENNLLNVTFRNVENPQHTNWEFNRIEDLSERNEVKSVYRELLDKIRDLITKHLANSDDSRTDLEGAGEYIPVIEKDNNSKNSKEVNEILDEVKIQKKKIKAKNVNLNASVEDKNGDGVEVDFINNINDGNESEMSPTGNNNGSGGGLHGGDNQESGEIDPSGHVGLKHAELRGMSYRFFCFNKKDRIYGVSFVSDFTEKEVYFELYAVDESGQKDLVQIEACLVNNENVDIIDDCRIKFGIESGKRYEISLITDQDDMFSGEVKLYAYR